MLMMLEAKKHLLLSELGFVVGCTQPGTVIWCVAGNGKLVLAARDESLTVRSTVPLLRVNQPICFGCFGVNGTSFLKVAHLGNQKTTTIELGQTLKLNNGGVFPFVGPVPSWVLDSHTATPSVIVNWKSLRGIVESAAKHVTEFEKGKYSGKGIGISLSDGQLRTHVTDGAFLYEHRLSVKCSHESFCASLPRYYLRAVMTLGFGPTSAVAIGTLDNIRQFACGPRLLRFQNGPFEIPFIDKVAPPTTWKRSFATSVSELRMALSRMAAYEKDCSNAVDISASGSCLRLITPATDDTDFEGEEGLPCICWEPITARLDCQRLMKLLNGIDGAVIVHSIEEKPVLAIEGIYQRILLFKMSAPEAT
jgi:hypothetical protein